MSEGASLVSGVASVPGTPRLSSAVVIDGARESETINATIATTVNAERMPEARG
jgi:hypothetical protein